MFWRLLGRFDWNWPESAVWSCGIIQFSSYWLEIWRMLQLPLMLWLSGSVILTFATSPVNYIAPLSQILFSCIVQPQYKWVDNDDFSWILHCSQVQSICVCAGVHRFFFHLFISLFPHAYIAFIREGERDRTLLFLIFYSEGEPYD